MIHTDYLEVNKKENPTDDEARIPSTAYSDNWATNENPGEIFHTAVKVSSNKDADTIKPDQDPHVIDITNMKTTDINKEETLKLIKHYMERSGESKTGWYSWESAPVEDTSRKSNDTSLTDTGKKACPDEISQGKTVKDEDT